MLPTKEEFNDTVQEILKREEYRELKSFFHKILESAKEKITNWFINRLDNVGFNLSQETIDNLSLILITAASLVLIIVAAVIIVKLTGSFEKKKEISKIHGEKITENTTPQSLRKKASKLRQENDYRQAVRFDFIALLLLMHEKGILYLEKSRTNKEIYQQLKEKRIPGMDIFKRLTFVFNQYWYGHKHSDLEGYQDWQHNFEIFWNEVLDYEV